MRAAEGASQKLAGKHFGVRGNWEHPAFRMQMLPRRHLVAACGETQSRVLDVLESLKRGRFHIPRPDRGRVIHLGPDEGFVGDNQRLGVLAPGSAGQGLHDPEALRARLRHRFGVGREGVERVKSHAQDLRILNQGDDAAADHDLRVITELMGVRRKKCYA